MSSTRTRSEYGSLRPVVETIGAMIAVSVGYWFIGSFARPLAAFLFVLSPPASVHPWTLATSVYAHAGLGHLLSNALVVVVAGVPVAASTTRTRFHAFVLVTGALSGLAQIWVSGLLSPAGVLGISGAAFALVGYVAAANPAADALGRFAGRLGVPPRVVVLAVGALAVGVTLVLSPAGSALVAHLVGLLLGIVAGRMGLLRV